MDLGKTTGSNLLDQFLTEFVAIYLIEAKTPIQSEDGYLEMPMIVEGIVWDYDDDWLLIGDDHKVQISLINRDLVAKMDIIDKTADIMDDPNKPNTKEEMN